MTLWSYLYLLSLLVAWAAAVDPALLDPLGRLAAGDAQAYVTVDTDVFAPQGLASPITLSGSRYVLASEDLRSIVEAAGGSFPAPSSALERAARRGRIVCGDDRLPGIGGSPFLLLLARSARLDVVAVDFVNCSRVVKLADSASLYLRFSLFTGTWQSLSASNASSLSLFNVSVLDSRIDYQLAADPRNGNSLAVVYLTGSSVLTADWVFVNSTGLSGPMPSGQSSQSASGLLRGSMLDVRESASAVVRNSSFGNGLAELGGAFNIEGAGASFLCERCDFFRNAAVFDGGVLRSAHGSRVRLLSVVSTGASAAAQGGHILLSTGSALEAINVLFLNGSATSGAGVMVRDSSSATLSNVTASFNMARANGGFLAAYDVARVNVSNSIVLSSWGEYGGGFAMHNNASLQLGGSSALNNIAAHSGGSVSLMQYSTMSITNCTFAGNVAMSPRGGGGAIYVQDRASADADGLVCTGNSAPGGIGGCLRGLYHGRFNAVRTTFSSNQAVMGGAVVLELGTMLIFDSGFCVDNLSTDIYTTYPVATGGCIAMWDDSIVNMTSSVMARNMAVVSQASHVHQGGAILGYGYIPDASQPLLLYLRNVLVEGNSAQEGGGVRMFPVVDGSRVVARFDNVTFRSNYASDGSCDIDILWLFPGDVRLRNCSFTDPITSPSVWLAASVASFDDLENSVLEVDDCSWRGGLSQLSQTRGAILGIRTRSQLIPARVSVRNIQFTNVKTLASLFYFGSDFGSVNATIDGFSVSHSIGSTALAVFVAGILDLQNVMMSNVILSGNAISTSYAVKARIFGVKMFNVSTVTRPSSGLMGFPLIFFRSSLPVTLANVSVRGVESFFVVYVEHPLGSTAISQVLLENVKALDSVASIHVDSGRVAEISEIRTPNSSSVLCDYLVGSSSAVERIILKNIISDGSILLLDAEVSGKNVVQLQDISIGSRYQRVSSQGVATFSMRQSGASVMISNVTASGLDLDVSSNLFRVTAYGGSNASVSLDKIRVDRITKRSYLGALLLLSYEDPGPFLPTLKSAVMVRGSNIQASNIVSRGGGGLLVATGSLWNVTLSNVTVQNVTSSDTVSAGDSVLLADGASLEMVKCAVDFSQASSGGFAGLSRGSKLWIRNSSVSSCLASGYLPLSSFSTAVALRKDLIIASGGMRRRSSANATQCQRLLDVLLEKKSEAIYKRLVARGADQDRTVGSGGVVSMDSRSSFFAEECTFIGNMASARGGALSVPTNLAAENIRLRKITSFANSALKGSLFHFNNPMAVGSFRSAFERPLSDCGLFDSGLATGAYSLVVKSANEDQSALSVQSGGQLPRLALSILDALGQGFRDPSFFSLILQGPKDVTLTGSLNVFGSFGYAEMSESAANAVFLFGRPGSYNLTVASDDLFASEYPSSRINRTFTISISPCPAGKYVDAASLGCRACPRGMFSTAMESRECQDPPAGFYTTDGIALKECADGASRSEWDWARCASVVEQKSTLGISLGVVVPVACIAGVGAWLIKRRADRVAKLREEARTWKIAKEDIEWVSVIGKGAYGEVWWVLLFFFSYFSL
jgi:hypothetical protein